MTNSINYGHLMHNAMRGLMASLLTDVGKNGLPGDHHFFITYDTTHDDVQMAAWLRDRYPDDITVVIQHWFEDLAVFDDHFTVTLNFGDSPEALVIPFDAIKTFVDPHVDFGLHFDSADIEEIHPDDQESPMIDIDDIDQEQSDIAPKGDAEIVTLDHFRK